MTRWGKITIATGLLACTLVAGLAIAPRGTYLCYSYVRPFIDRHVRICDRCRFPCEAIEHNVVGYAVRRALEGKALFLVPTLLVIQRDGQWSIQCGFVPSGAKSPFAAGIRVVAVTQPRVPVVDPSIIVSLRADVLSLAGSPAERRVEASLAASGHGGRVLVVKRVAEAKNLGNKARATG